jgi:hypothetical protein
MITKNPGSALKKIDVILYEDNEVFGVVSHVEFVKDAVTRVQSAQTKRPFLIAGEPENMKFGITDVEDIAEKDDDLIADE